MQARNIVYISARGSSEHHPHPPQPQHSLKLNLQVYVQFFQYQLSPGTGPFIHLEGEIAVSVQKAADAEVQIQIYAKMLHLQIGILHQGFCPGMMSNLVCISGHFGLHVKVINRSGYPAHRHIVIASW